MMLQPVFAETTLGEKAFPRKRRWKISNVDLMIGDYQRSSSFLVICVDGLDEYSRTEGEIK
jgi:hypothetical protein